MDSRSSDRAAQPSAVVVDRLVTRREMLRGGVGGGLLLGLFALGAGGCKGGMSRGADPNWQPSASGAALYAPPPMTPPAQSVAPSRGVQIYSRSSWTSAGVARPQNIDPMNGVSRITVHHDGMEPFTSTSQGDAARRIEGIRGAHLVRYAKNGKQWADIGYHYIVDPAGRVYEGRNIRYQGAHVQDNNEHNLGIMVLGNFNRQRPTAASMGALEALIAMQMSRFRVRVSQVRTHREFARTECPGENLQAFMNQTRGRGGRLAMAAGEMRLA